MRRVIATALAALLAAGVLAAQASATPLVAAYWGPYSIYGNRYLPKDLPVDLVQVLNVALAFPTAAGRCGADPWVERTRRFGAAESVDGRADDPDPTTLGGVVHQLQLLRRAHPKLKVIVTIAEGAPARRFANAARSDAARRKFARSCINRYIRGNYPGIDRAAPRVFDGIDLDWEVPQGEVARHNFTLLAREFRRQLGAIDRRLLLTAAIGVDRGQTRHFELLTVSKELNWVNLMGYQLGGAWSPVTQFQAPLLKSPNVPEGSPTAAQGVAMFLHRGVPKRKLVLGLPFFGKAYANVSPGTTAGIGRPFSGMLAGTTGGNMHYHDIVDRFGGLPVHHDTRAAQAWIYDPVGRTTVVFDDPDSVSRKMAFVRRLELRGAMTWEITQDTPAHDLLRAMADGRR